MSYKIRLILVFTLVILVACKDETNIQSVDLSTSIVTGKVINQEYYSHIKSIDLTIPDFPGNIIVHSCPIEADGTFRLEIQPLVPRDVTLYPLVDYVYVHPGDSIYLILDFANIRNVSFSGDASVLNTNINTFMSNSYIHYLTDAYTDYFSEGYVPTVGDYKHYCDSIRYLNLDRREHFINKYNPSEEFISWTQKCIDVDYYQKLLEYPLSQAVITKSDWDFPDEYYEFINKLDDMYSSSTIYSGIFDLANAYLKAYYSPKVFLDHHISYSDIDSFSSNGSDQYLKDRIINNYYSATDSRSPKQFWAYYKSRHEIDSLIIYKLAQKVSVDILNQYLLSTYFHNYFNINTLDIYSRYTAVYNESISDPFLKETLDSHLKRTKEYLENPHIISNAIRYGNEFEDPEPYEFSSGRNLLDSIILKNKGKAIYAYFWTTWCPPCIDAAPKFNNLMRKYKDESIEFVFLCLDNNPQRDSIIASLYEGGTHYLCTPSEGKTLGNRFNFFGGIPYSLLINNEGDIIDYGQHIKPDDKYTIEKIEQMIR